MSSTHPKIRNKWKVGIVKIQAQQNRGVLFRDFELCAQLQ
jgi:hypothetical protein